MEKETYSYWLVHEEFHFFLNFDNVLYTLHLILFTILGNIILRIYYKNAFVWIQIACKHGWKRYNDHCYHLFSARMNWFEAQVNIYWFVVIFSNSYVFGRNKVVVVSYSLQLYETTVIIYVIEDIFFLNFIKCTHEKRSH